MICLDLQVLMCLKALARLEHPRWLLLLTQAWFAQLQLVALPLHAMPKR